MEKAEVDSYIKGLQSNLGKMKKIYSNLLKSREAVEDQDGSGNLKDFIKTVK